nr:MAG TPA: hypothetical protein [Caudoviricetes sp.]
MAWIRFRGDPVLTPNPKPPVIFRRGFRRI